MNIQENQIIGELVAQDYRTAAVFKSFGIDFCCKGNRTSNRFARRHQHRLSIVAH